MMEFFNITHVASSTSCKLCGGHVGLPPIPLIKLFQLGKLWGAWLKIAKLKFTLSRHSLAHIRASLQAVVKMVMMDFFRNLMHTKH